MVTFERIPPKRKYGQFFLASEAPGDPQTDVATQPSDQYQPADNTRVINVTPGEKVRRINFDAIDQPDQGQAAPQDAPNPAVSGQDQPTNMPVTPGDTNAPMEPTVNDANTTNGLGQPDPNGPDVVDSGSVDPNDPNVQGDASGAVDGPAIDDPGTNINFSDDQNPGEDGTPPGQGDPNEQKTGHGIEYDSTRRYNLFKDFMELHTSVDGFIEKLENVLSDDADQNFAIINATKKLREIKDLLKDYMLLRFESSTYAQSLLYYELMKTTTYVTVKSLHKVKTKIEKEQLKDLKKQKRKQQKTSKNRSNNINNNVSRF